MVGATQGVVDEGGMQGIEPMIVSVAFEVPFANVNVLDDDPVHPPSSPSAGVQFCQS